MNKKYFLWLLLSLLLVQRVLATPAIVQGSCVDGSGTTTKSITLTGVASGDSIVVLPQSSGGALSSLTDSQSQTLTIDLANTTYTESASTFYITIQRISSALSGTHTFSATWGTSGGVKLCAVEISGIGAFDQISAIATGSSSTPASANITPLHSGEMVLGMIHSSTNSLTLTWSGSLAQITGATVTVNGGSIFMGSYVQATVAAVNSQGTLSASHNWGAIVWSYQASGSSSCTNQGITSAGAIAVPNGTSGSYRLKNGSFGTPDCSTVQYRQTSGNFGVN